MSSDETRHGYIIVSLPFLLDWIGWGVARISRGAVFKYPVALSRREHSTSYVVVSLSQSHTQYLANNSSVLIPIEQIGPISLRSYSETQKLRAYFESLSVFFLDLGYHAPSGVAVSVVDGNHEKVLRAFVPNQNASERYGRFAAPLLGSLWACAMLPVHQTAPWGGGASLSRSPGIWKRLEERHSYFLEQLATFITGDARGSVEVVPATHSDELSFAFGCLGSLFRDGVASAYMPFVVEGGGRINNPSITVLHRLRKVIRTAMKAVETRNGNEYHIQLKPFDNQLRGLICGKPLTPQKRRSRNQTSNGAFTDIVQGLVDAGMWLELSDAQMVSDVASQYLTERSELPNTLRSLIAGFVYGSVIGYRGISLFVVNPEDREAISQKAATHLTTEDVQWMPSSSTSSRAPIDPSVAVPAPESVTKQASDIEQVSAHMLERSAPDPSTTPSSNPVDSAPAGLHVSKHPYNAGREGFENERDGSNSVSSLNASEIIPPGTLVSPQVSAVRVDGATHANQMADGHGGAPLNKWVTISVSPAVNQSIVDYYLAYIFLGESLDRKRFITKERSYITKRTDFEKRKFKMCLRRIGLSSAHVSFFNRFVSILGRSITIEEFFSIHIEFHRAEIERLIKQAVHITA